jgi:hypothetical protein
MRRIVVALSLLVLLLGTGCHRQGHEPARPKGVPPEAVWAGGPDGGSFFLCIYDKSTGTYQCTVYNDFTGKVDATGHFKASGSANMQGSGALEYSGFDGRTIYLKNGGILEPTDDVQFPVN